MNILHSTVAEFSEAESLLFGVVVTLAMAVLVGMVMRRLNQNIVVGYLLAGVLVGPGALNLVSDVESFLTLAEIGVALLLFTIGLELSWTRLRFMGRVSAWAGIAQLVLTVSATALVLWIANVSIGTAVVIGMVISLSSTAVVLRVLVDRAEIDSVHGLAAFGVLLVQDLATVLFLLAIPLIGDGGQPSVIAVMFLESLVKLVVLVLVMYLLDLIVVRRLFHHAAGAERELLALLSIAISLGAAGAADAMGLSPIVGAFVAGILIGGAPYADQVRAEVAPLQTGLVALFFATIGMLADVGWIATHLLQIAGAVVAVVVGKAVLAGLALRLARIAVRPAFLTAVALAQMGEFSFALATAAVNAGVLNSETFQLIVSTSLFTLLMTPYLIALSNRIVYNRRGLGIPLLQELGERDAEDRRTGPPQGHALVIGYGPAGRRVVEALREAEVPVTIIELNPRLNELEEAHVRVVFGDAVRAEILQAAQVQTARIAIVTVPDAANVGRIVRQVRALNPGIRLIVRGRYHIYLQALRDAGATAVIDEETETGRLLAAETLRQLHETSEARPLQ